MNYYKYSISLLPADLYACLLAPQSSVLDLCSSWCSHLPQGLQLLETCGHGMSKAELDANAALSRRWVKDLNQDPRMAALRSGSMDAVLCCNGLQYLQHLEEVMRAWANFILGCGGEFH